MTSFTPKYRSSMRRRFACSAAAGAIAIFSPLGASAQTADDAVVLDEIIVTSQKREQSILDVPISVTAVSGDRLEERGFSEVADLEFIAPGLQFNQGNTSRISNIGIRGIGTSTFSDSIEGSVGIVLDGVVIGRAGGGLFDLADIERVEVLRGPQGTLFGKNASAGLLNIVTKAPTDEFSYTGTASYGTDDEVRVGASISGGLFNGVTGRLTGYYNRRDGQIENVVTGQDLNDRNELGLRAKLNFDLGADTDLLLIGDWSERDFNCCAWTTRVAAPAGPGNGLFGSGFSIIGATQAGLGIVPGPDNEQVATGGAFASFGRIQGASATFTTRFGDVDFTSITAYREWSQKDNNDADQTPRAILDINFGDSTQDQFTQEIRFSGNVAEQLDWTLGAFYFDQNVRTDSTQAGSYGLDILGAVPAGSVFDRFLSIQPETTNYAVFGDFTLALSDRFSVLGGMRLQNEEISVDFTRSNNVNPITPFVLGPAFGPFSGSLSEEDEAVTWRLGMTYDATDDLNLYATVTQGYKGPGINTNVDTTQLNVVEPEVPTSFEVGAKSLLFGGRANANIASYYTTFDNFQAEALTRNAAGLIAFDITNAGELEVYGIEGDITAQVTEELFFAAGATLSSSTYAEFEGAACFNGQTAAQGCVNGFQDLSGADLPNSPDFTANASFTYARPVFSGLEGIGTISGYYRDDVITAQDQDPNTRIDAYGFLDASIGLRDENGAWEITAFVKNLTDEDFVESIFDTPFDNGGYSQFLTPESDRRFGIRFRVQG